MHHSDSASTGQTTGIPAHLDCEVLVVGAGPTGLMLGSELRRRGVDCLVVDQATGIDQRTRAVMVHAASLEQLQDLGVRTTLEKRGLRQHRIRFYAHHGGVHTVCFTGLDTPYPYYLNIPQPAVEAVLGAAFRDLGGRLVRGLRYEGHHEEDDGVRADAVGPDGPHTITARYLVGADGASSAVREHLGIGFDGVTYPMSYLLAEGRPRVAPDPQESAMYSGPTGTVSLLPLPGDTVRVAGPATAEMVERDAALSAEQFQATVDLLGFGDTLRLATAERVAVYSVHERLADRFRVGRTLLAGDAAHLNSPAGGQAMNTGFADAAGLGWRLSRALRGYGTALLDDYARERRAAAQHVAQTTSVLGLLQGMREAVTAAAREVIDERLEGYAEAWSQLYLTYPVGDILRPGAVWRREEHLLQPGARLPGHAPDRDRFALLHAPGHRPPAAVRLPADTLTGELSGRQAAWLPPGAEALVVRPDRHVEAVVSEAARAATLYVPQGVAA